MCFFLNHEYFKHFLVTLQTYSYYFNRLKQKPQKIIQNVEHNAQEETMT